MSASLTDGQLYVLRPASAPGMQMAIGSSSKVNGAKAIIYAANEYWNDQKWVATDYGGAGWTLTNLESNKQTVVWWVVDDPFVPGTDIVQWAGGSTNLYLAPEQVGTETVDGVECPVVVFKLKSNTGLAYSVSDALYYGSLKVALASTDAGSETQQWVCIPTAGRDSSIAAPYNAGVTGATEKYCDTTVSFSVYPAWEVAPAIAARSGVTYLMRSRSRTMGLSGTWGEWTAWGLFKAATVSQDGQSVSGTTAITATVASTDKLAQAEYEVRACVPGSGIWGWAGGAASCTATFYVKPVVALSNATWSPDGISIAATSNYGARGATEILVESVVLGTAEILAQPCTSTLTGASGTVGIPQELLTGIPADGSTITVSYRVASDQRQFDDVLDDDLTVSYTAGSFTPTITALASDLTLKVAADDGSRVWVRLDGRIYECPQNADGTYRVIYPFGRQYELFAAGMHSSAKYAYYEKRTESTRPCHAWNWDGGFACLEVREGEPLSSPETVEAVYESYVLNGRDAEAVSVAPTKRHRLTADGALVYGKTASSVADFHELTGKHAVYRSPRGAILDVVAVSCTPESFRNWASMSVSMIRESG